MSDKPSATKHPVTYSHREARWLLPWLLILFLLVAAWYWHKSVVLPVQEAGSPTSSAPLHP